MEQNGSFGRLWTSPADMFKACNVQREKKNKTEVRSSYTNGPTFILKRLLLSI